MKSALLRQSFVDFFKHKDHTLVRSDNIVPQKDPTLLFTTAGMVQFKPLWMGAPLPYARAVSVQKSFRAGGKGSDLENVGKTLRHHTFFEMLGNFSFGDYFKEEAIVWAWEFITQVLRLDTERLWVSVYKDDAATADIWTKKVGFPKNRIVFLGEKDNFWGPAGDSGACGPCSEIYIDLGPAKSCGKPNCAVGCDCERYLEFWNLVFPQFDQQKDGSRLPLQRRGIDTGMGLERLSYIMQGVNSTYETDLFAPIIANISSLTKHVYKQSRDTDYAMHVIADHVRALTFAFSENILPSNEGRGYVLRRILRRAYRFGGRVQMNQPFLHKLVPAVVDVMGPIYPELKEAQARVVKMIEVEEKSFQQTLDGSQAILSEILGKAHDKKQAVSGEDAFKLYDTYGFPLDMLRDIAEEQKLLIDEEGFQRCMQSQKERARKGWSGASKDVWVKSMQGILAKEGVTRFLGYSQLEASSRVVGLVSEGQSVNVCGAGEEKTYVVCAETPFYAESGGQAGDHGKISTSSGCLATVVQTEKIIPDLYAHQIVIQQGTLRVGDVVKLSVNAQRRSRLACNHTATHILHSVLREQLGAEVKQAGSLVEDSYLRFDFNYFEAIDEAKLAAIEAEVNERIWRNEETVVCEQSLEQAKKSGAVAFFDEKYGDTVRVVSLGNFSKEFCGGTHIQRTGSIGFLKIVSEGSVASGTRRIVAVTGPEAYAWDKQRESWVKQLSRELNVKDESLVERVLNMRAELKDKEKLLKEQERRSVLALLDGAEKNIKQISGVSVFTAVYPVKEAALLKDLCDVLVQKFSDTVIILAANVEGKAVFVVACPASAVAKGLKAGNIVKDMATAVGGNGGGRPDFAQAGAQNGSAVNEAMAMVSDIVARALKKT